MNNDPALLALLNPVMVFVVGFMTPPQVDFKTVETTYKGIKGDDKKEIDKTLGYLCKSFLTSPDYKKGDTSNVGYKMCCEMMDYCSFYKQPWFFMVGAGALGLLIYLISMTIVGVCLLKKKRGGGGGGAPPKTPKTGKSIGKPSKKK
ncbi:unnamed protein product [Caenorhabditis brenneri]